MTEIFQQKSENTFKTSSRAQVFYFQMIESNFERMTIHLIGFSQNTISALMIISCIIWYLYNKVQYHGPNPLLFCVATSMSLKLRRNYTEV